MADRGLDAPIEGLAERLARLERRLERERAARLAAEAIGENGTRELHEQKRHLLLLEAIATASNLGGSVESALSHALQQICDFTQWPLGHVYLVRRPRGSPKAVSARRWHAAPGFDFAAFQQLSQDISFRAGEGLPGQVMASGAAAWMTDVTVESNFPRAVTARQCGLHAAFAFPVLVGSEVAAVLEFFSDRRVGPDPALLRTMAQIGVQLGRVIERSRAERELRARNTELRRLIKDAETQRAAAEAANRAKSAFLAVTSHEIRTPLNAVLGLAEGLRREPLTEHQHDLVDGVLDSGTMLLRLLNAVLDLSRIEANRAEADLAPFDLGLTVKTIVRVWRAKAEELGLHLVLDFAATPSPCVLVSDQGKIEQTLINLLANAVKFSPRGGSVVIRVAVQAIGQRRRVHAEVVDQGPGIAPEDGRRIFDAFEQTALGREAGGAGLGLAICAGHMSVLGGVLAYDSPPGGGSRFWFEFEADAAGEALPEASAPEEPAMEAERPLRVLAAEDNAANRRVLQVLLEPLDVAVSFVEDGVEAVSAMERQAFDLVLMDANMPRMDGVTAVRRIRAMAAPASGTPIYMLTANVFDEDIQLYHSAGVDGVLRKPIEVPHLYAALEAAALPIDPPAPASDTCSH